MDILRDSDLYRRVLESAYDGIYVTDLHRKIVYWNQGAERLSGYKAEEVVGKSCADNVLVHVDDQGNSLCLGMCPLAHTLHDGELREADVFLHHRDGHRVPVSVRVTPVMDDGGHIVGAIEIFSDNSTKVAALELAETFQEISITDPLTGVGNRRYTEISLLARIDEFQKEGVPFAMFIGDLDGFKRVNDDLGHLAGDQALKATAQTLRGGLKSFDFVGRWGGDEFALIFPNIRDKESLEVLGERLRMLVENSFFFWEGHRVHCTMSLGGTLGRVDDTAETAFARADQALYRSKEAGKNRVTVL